MTTVCVSFGGWVVCINSVFIKLQSPRPPLRGEGFLPRAPRVRAVRGGYNLFGCDFLLTDGAKFLAQPVVLRKAVLRSKVNKPVQGKALGFFEATVESLTKAEFEQGLGEAETAGFFPLSNEDEFDEAACTALFVPKLYYKLVNPGGATKIGYSMLGRRFG